MYEAFMLDTTTFNALCKGWLSWDALHAKRLFTTRIQLGEIEQTENIPLRERLRHTFETVDAEVKHAAQFVFDLPGAGFDCAEWGENADLHSRLLQRLRELDGVDKGLNQVADAVLVETAMKHRAILVAGDKNLLTAAKEVGASVMSLEEFSLAQPSDATARRLR
jgi:hypothetical protein